MRNAFLNLIYVQVDTGVCHDLVVLSSRLCKKTSQRCAFPPHFTRIRCRKASYSRAILNILCDTALRHDNSALANARRRADAGLPANHCALADHGPASKPDLGRQNSARTNLTIMGDMDKIIEHGLIADPGLSKGAPINTAPGPDQNGIANLYTANMWQRHRPVIGNLETETGTADHGTGLDRDIITNAAVRQHRIRFDMTVPSYLNAFVDNSPGPD
jgi:hypothetical protein